MSSAVACSAWVPVRSEPSHRAELVSQWICGERLRVLDRRGDWLFCLGPDGYEGWSPRGSLLELEDVEADAWESRATAYSLATSVRPTASAPGVPAEASAPNHLPWGARVRVLEGGEIELAAGLRMIADEPASVVQAAAMAKRFPRDGESIVHVARRWLGAPYLWGGRTQSGVDCSGFVQAVFAVHGIRLPRDSADQADVGVRLPVSGNLLSGPDVPQDASSNRVNPGKKSSGVEPGDLLFFAPEGEGVTHVAIASGGPGSGLVIHAAANRGCVTEDDLTADGALPRLLRTSIVARTRPLG